MPINKEESVKKLIAILTLSVLSACSSNIDFKEMAVDDILKRTTDKRLHVWATTQFEVQSTGVGSCTGDKKWIYDSGASACTDDDKWFLNSGKNYRSSNSLNVHLAPQLISAFKKKYGVDNVNDLNGRTIKVVGTALPKAYCVHAGCPSRPGRALPSLYVQTQMIIEDLANIEVL